MNDSNKFLSVFKKYIFPVIIFLLLSLVPFFFLQYNQKSTKRLMKTFPQLFEVSGSTGDALREAAERDYYVVFESNMSYYVPYQPIILNLAVSEKQNGLVLDDLTPYVVVQDENGNLLPDIFGRTKIPLLFSQQDHYFSVKLMLNNPEYIGDLVIKAVIEMPAFDAPSEKILHTKIILPSPNSMLSNTFTFLTLDSKETINERSILSVSGRETSINHLYEWFSMMNIDAVLMPSAISKTFISQNVSVPWDIEKLQESLRLAKDFSRRGKDVAFWVQALEVEGIELERLGYMESQQKIEYQKSNFSELSVISLSDRKRFFDLYFILSNHIAESSVNYVGLSKIFFGDSYHEELKPIFLKDFPGLANHHIFDHAFGIWKKYTAVSYFRDLIKKLKSQKSQKKIFMMLDSADLLAYPSMLLMMFATGIDFVMLDIDLPIHQIDNFYKMLESNTLFKIFLPYIVISYRIDYNNFVEGDISAPENWINQNLRSLDEYNINSLRINDLYRSMFGNRGVYTAYEWMLSAASLVDQWKSQREKTALLVNILPNTRWVTNSVVFNVQLQNNTNKIISNIIINLLPLLDLERLFEIRIPELKIKETFRTNFILDNVNFKSSVVQKQTRFIGFHIEYQLFKEARKMQNIQLLSFLDQSSDKDLIYSAISAPILPVPEEKNTNSDTVIQKKSNDLEFSNVQEMKKINKSQKKQKTSVKEKISKEEDDNKKSTEIDKKVKKTPKRSLLRKNKKTKEE
ncbi:hypothetical protein SAMN02745150_00112 [Brevinema andersonii]|uniref:Uncharacterized protein n=1 Tax=Brevinema andersonii TaxID=34097 RepID=A0A1I1D4W2_BREAD|nr:hypothetical protein [Brevinema andersonii]SFB67830.1 hypothetical protein SAMN02745150_00112 [Brevinema andersonii]